MKRSKNHILYELFLDEVGEEVIFDKTKSYSLGHIVTFVDVYEFLTDDQSAVELLKIATKREYESLEDVSNDDLNLYSSIRGLYSTLDSFEVDTVNSVIERIDSYHANRT